MNRLGHQMDRRHLIAAGAGASAVALAGVNVAGQASPTASEASPVASGWSFTDDQGRTVTLPKRPERIIAYVSAASSLWDLGIKPIAIFGPVYREDGTTGPQVGRIDLDQVEILDDNYMETNLEQFVANSPDLIVSLTWSSDPANGMWGIDPDMLSRAETIAPLVAINYFEGTSLITAIERIEELAVSLGADLTAPAIVADAKAFDAATVAAAEAIAAKPDLVTEWIAASADGVYICGPSYYADLNYFSQLGLNILEPDPSGTAVISWELIGNYPADVVFNDFRESGYYFTTEVLLEQPAFALHPAAQAGQIGNWYYDYILSRAGSVFILEELTAALNRFEIILE